MKSIVIQNQILNASQEVAIFYKKSSGELTRRVIKVIKFTVDKNQRISVRAWDATVKGFRTFLVSGIQEIESIRGISQ